MSKVFFGRIFELAGTIGTLDCDRDDYKGVYIIVCPNDLQKIYFNKCSNAGKFKGKDPTVSIDILKQKWVNDEEVLYIGKSETGVGKRMRRHIDFWKGKPVAAWGGRIIAQIQNYDNLEVWYSACDNPKQAERELLDKFYDKHTKLPFANFRK